MSVSSRGTLSLLLTLLLMGCGTEPEPAPAGLNGNFGGRLVGGTDFFGLSVRESDGVITGTAWSGISPSLDRSAQVTGSLAGATVALRMAAPAGQLDWFFNGAWDGDSLRGELALAPGTGFNVWLGRVDTIPSGNATLSVRGAETGDASGKARFGYDQQNQPLLAIDTGAPLAATLLLSWTGRVRPGVGDTPLGGSGGPAVTFIQDPDAATPALLTVTAGTLRIVHSNRFTLTGRIDLTARSPSGGIVTVSSTFSAGCVFGIC